jgi:hypothetical protein
MLMIVGAGYLTTPSEFATDSPYFFLPTPRRTCASRIRAVPSRPPEHGRAGGVPSQRRSKCQLTPLYPVGPDYFLTPGLLGAPRGLEGIEGTGREGGAGR